MKSTVIKALVVVAILACGGFGYKKWQAGKAAPAAAGAPGAGMAMPVQTATIATRDLVVTVTAVGALTAGESADIRAEVAGVVKAINFQEGQPVKKGDNLIEIDDALIKSENMKAEATYNVRKTTFSRSDKLNSSGYVSKQDWETSKGSLQEAEADLASTKIQLEKTKVTVPFDGLVGLRAFSVGDYLKVGDAITTLDAIDPVKVSFSVPEKNYGEIKVGQKISFSVDAWPGQTFEGEIYAISPRVDQGAHNFDVKAAIPNPEAKLRPGMYARVAVTTSTHAGAIMVPEQAIIPKGDESYVFAVVDGKAVFKKVTLGIHEPGFIEVLGGLSVGDQVVVAGLMALRDGAPVMILPAQGAEQGETK